MAETELLIGRGVIRMPGLGEVARFVGPIMKPSAFASTITKLSPP